MGEPLNVQHVNVKIFAEEPVSIDLGDAIPVFHRWIQEGVCEELMVDVADYRHVPAGPGVILIGHEANYSLDCAGDRLGLLYNRKTLVEGSTQDKLLKAFYAALVACRRLEEEEPFQARLKFNAGELEIIFNDRLLTPNKEETWMALKPEFEKFLTGVLRARTYTLQRLGEPRERFRVAIRSDQPVKARFLLEAFQTIDG